MFDLPALLQQCAPGVAPAMMQAVIRVESNFRPNVIGSHVVARDGSAFKLEAQPANKEQAVSWARWLLDKGYKFDAGIAQINSGNFPRYGLTPESVFEPCTNIRTGAHILTACYAQAIPRYGGEQAALLAALSCYNSGSFKTGFNNGYVAKVTAAVGVDLGPLDLLAPPLQALGKERSKAGKREERTNPMTATTTVEAFGNSFGAFGGN